VERFGRDADGSVAVATGGTLVVARVDAAQATVRRIDAPFEPVALAAGNVDDTASGIVALGRDGGLYGVRISTDGGEVTPLARISRPGGAAVHLVAARVAPGRRESLLALDAGARRLEVVTALDGSARVAAVAGAPVAVLALRLDADAFSDLVVLD